MCFTGHMGFNVTKDQWIHRFHGIRGYMGFVGLEDIWVLLLLKMPFFYIYFRNECSFLYFMVPMSVTNFTYPTIPLVIMVSSIKINETFLSFDTHKSIDIHMYLISMISVVLLFFVSCLSYVRIFFITIYIYYY